MFQSIVIGQVTGVTMTCRPDTLINNCTVMWNVSNCFLCVFVYVSTTVGIGGVHMYLPYLAGILFLVVCYVPLIFSAYQVNLVCYVYL